MEATEQQELRCVSCNVLKPANGKLLHCLHVICLECLKDSIYHPGCIKCMLCNYVTTPTQLAVDLSKQLANCCPIVYTSELPDEAAATNVTQPTRFSAAASSISQGSQVSCSYCSDIDVERRAQYTCSECRDAPLCDVHSKRHTQHTGHSVCELTASSTARKLALARACIVHPRNDVTQYCNTCAHSVCERCMRRGHESHSVERLSLAAKKQRAVLVDMLKTRSSQMPTSDTQVKSGAVKTNRRVPISTRMSSVKEEIDDVGAQAEAASLEIMETFDKIEKMVAQKKKEMLSEVDAKSWSLLQPLQASKDRLCRLQQQEGTAAKLINILSSADSDDMNVMELSPLINLAFKRLEEAEEDKADFVHCDIKIDAQVTFDLMEKAITPLLPVTCERPLDIETAEFVLPECVIAGEQAVIRIKPRKSTLMSVTSKTSLDDVIFRLIQPNGEAREVAVIQSVDKLAVEISFLPLVNGLHLITVEVGDKRKQFRFLVKPAGHRWDAAKCSPHLSISGNEARVMSRDDWQSQNSCQNYEGGCVLAEAGYSSGCHKWGINYRPGTKYSNVEYPEFVAIGVCRKPSDCQYSSGSFSSLSYYWRSHGNVCGNGTSSQPFKDYSQIEFTLDCDNRTLSMHFRGCDQREPPSVIYDLDCSEPLYPAVYLYTPTYRIGLFEL